MELREALEVLGPERVRRGMKAIDSPRHTGGSTCSSCFVGEAFGGTSRGYFDAIGCKDNNSTRRRLVLFDRLRRAARLCERYYEGPDTTPGYFDDSGEIHESRRILREACVTFLAEHGETVEPQAIAPAPTGKAS